MDIGIFPVPFLLVVSILACLIGAIIKADYSKKNKDKPGAYAFFCAINSAVCGLTLFAMNGFTVRASVYTVLLSVAFGVITMLSAVFSAAALAIGPVSFTTVIISFSTVITALSGFLFFSESLGWNHIVGIALMSLCFIFSVKKEEGEQKKVSLRWLLLALLSSVASAGVGMLQKVHQSSEHKDELMAFLIIAFVFATLSAFVQYFIQTARAGKPESKTERTKKGAALVAFLLVFAGICVAVNNVNNLYLCGVMESAIFFPLVNGSHLILSILAGLVLFKERLTLKQWIGITSGVIATLFLCL